MSNNLINEAQFLLRVSEENSIANLRTILSGASPEHALPILRRINQLCDGKNVEVLLSLAVRSFHQGQDDEAISFDRQARQLKPDDHQVLRVALFLTAALGEIDDAKALSRRLLIMYPSDDWARAVDNRLNQEGTVSRLSLPPIQTEWAAILNQNRSGT